jgi:hypothetical protein
MADENPNPAPWQPSTDTSSDPQGGEWDLLTTKVKEWSGSEAPQQLWQQLRTPLKVIGWLLAGLLVLRVYGAVLEALDGFPLLPGLLELTGLVWLCRFTARNLLHRNDRDQLFADLNRLWSSRGQDD